MKPAISETRKQLPALLRRVRNGAGSRVEISVHNKAVAELRAVQPGAKPRGAAKTLLRLMKKLPKPGGRKITISAHIKPHLYGSRGAIR